MTGSWHTLTRAVLSALHGEGFNRQKDQTVLLYIDAPERQKRSAQYMTSQFEHSGDGSAHSGRAALIISNQRNQDQPKGSTPFQKILKKDNPTQTETSFLGREEDQVPT